jgi:hypothetical protein
MGQCFSYYVINTSSLNRSSAGTVVLCSLSQIKHKFLNLDTALERFISMYVNILVLLSFTQWIHSRMRNKYQHE